MNLRKILICALGIAATPTCAFAQLLSPPPLLPTVDKNGVDVKTRQVNYSQTFMSIGPPDNRGLKYTYSYSSYVARDNFATLYTDTEGYGEPTYSFQRATVGNFSDSFTFLVPDTGDGSSLGGGYYTRKDGTVVAFTHDFGASGCNPITQECISNTLADSIAYPDGTTWTFHYRDDFTPGYPQSTRLQSVTTNTGYQIKYNYAANSITSPGTRAQYFQITSVVAINNAVEYCDPSADSCSVSSSWPSTQYTSSGIVDPRGNLTTFGGSLTTFEVKTPDSSSYNIIYNLSSSYDACANGNIFQVTSATINGRTTTYSVSSGGVVSSAPLSQQYTYGLIGGATACLSAVASITDPLGRITTANYDLYLRLLKTTSPEGNYTQNAIDGYTTPPPGDARGNITQSWEYPKSGSSSPALTESRTFPNCTSTNQKTCNQPATYTDPRGHTTTYAYDDAHGGVLTETDSPDANGINPVKRYAYAQRYAWIKDATGAYVHAPSQVWVRTEERTCQTTATVGGSCAGGSSDEIVTSYDYGPDSGPNNLLLRGKVVTSNGVSLRACYGYDQYGNKISETSPRAGLTSCP